MKTQNLILLLIFILSLTLVQAQNNALEFDGTDDYVISTNATAVSANSTLTIEAWVRPDVIKESVFAAHGITYLSIGMNSSGEVVSRTYTGSSGQINNSGYKLVANSWYHIAAVFSGGESTIYVNGLKVGLTSACANSSADGRYYYIGYGYIVNETYFDGQIDEVRIWSTARTATQIRENMCRTLDGDEGGLVAYYRLNETSGTTAYDATGIGNNGTLINMDGSSDWVDSESFTTWLGVTNSDWSTASNWTDGVPASTDNVGIYNWTGNNEVTIDGETLEVNNLLISSTSEPTLSSGITVNGNLLLEKDMDLNGQTITLGSSATLVEDAGVFSGTTGSITTIRTLNNIDEDVAGLGAKITTSADMGSTTITRTHAQASGNVSSSILRRYAISPSTNTGLNATLEFNYLDSELNGLKEANFQLLKSSDGTNWSAQGGIVSRADNTITLSGIDGFSNWTVNSYIQPTNNYALDFDGSDDYVAIPDNNALDLQTNYTLEAWVYPRAYGFYVGIISKYQTEGVIGYTLRMLTDGKIDFDAVTTTEVVINNLNTWYHIAAVNNNGTRHVYINGIEVTTTGTANTVPVNTDELRIGSDFGRSINAIIDEARMWNDVRTATEIRENMCRTLDGDETNLVAYYRLNEASGTTAYDATVNGNNGTLMNMDGSSDWVDSKAFNTWLGGTSAVWATETNWTDGVPESTDNVGLYDFSGGNDPVISTGQTLNNLVVGSDVTIQVSAGENLTINGNFFNYGNFAVASTGMGASGTGSLIVNGSVAGSVNTERYIEAATWGTWDDGWHFVSSPVADFDIASSNFVVATAADYDFYAWSEPDNLWINFKNTSTSPTFTEVNGSDDFELGHGYLVAYKNTETKLFTGSINVEDVTVNGITNTGGTTNNHSWHLLGNPFNSALTWDDTWTKTNIGGSIQIWNEAGRSYTIIAANPGGVIPATNGFLIQGTDATTGSVTIPKSKRVHSSQAFYKGTEFPIIKLKAVNLDNTSFQESQLHFNPESSVGYETEYDCSFLSGYAPMFYSEIEEMPMALNSMPNLEETTTIPFTFIKNEGLNFGIEMYEQQNLELDVWLLDKQLNKNQNLSENPVYTFAAFENDNPNRFVVHFSPVGLPEIETISNPIHVYSNGRGIHVINNNNLTGEITILNIHGQQMDSFKLDSSLNQSHHVDFPAGVYLVYLKTTNGHVYSEKVIVL